MRKSLRLAAWLLLAPLALNAADFSQKVPGLPASLPAEGASAELPKLPAEVLRPSAADEAAALSPIPAVVIPAEAVVSQASPAEAVRAALAAQSGEIAKSLSDDPSGRAALEKLQSLFAGSKRRRDDSRGASQASQQRAKPIENDEGMLLVTGRTKDYYHEIKRLEALLKAKGVKLDETMNVMDDAYAEIRAKLLAVESLAREKTVKDTNAHVKLTLTWVDGVITGEDGRRTAIQTNRVFFHPAPNRESEIAEGKRRAAKTLDQLKAQFAPGGAAEQTVGAFDDVVLAFDTRGYEYEEIKQYIKSRESEFGPRYRFAFTDEMAPMPKNVQQMREDVRRLAAHFPENQKELENIYDGVTYSRYTGLLLELKAIEYYLGRGYKILESGRDFFDPQGRYKTEFDAVLLSPEGEVVIVEAKSARVPLALVEDKEQQGQVNEDGMLDVMEEKFLYKLRMYRDFRPIIEDYVRKHYGNHPIRIDFVTDPGGTVRRAAQEGVLVWSDKNGPSQRALMEHIQQVAPELSGEYGYPVSFVFLNSHPHEDPMLFYQEPMDLGAWKASSHKHGGRGRR